MHLQLQAFFNHSHDALVAAMRASTGMSSSTKGAEREDEIGDLFQAMLPPIAKLESGDILDASGHSTGQLDRVVVHHTGPMARRKTSGRGFILAEGAIAVIEVKSNLATQWSEVEAKWAKVHPVRVDGKALPFFVIGLGGWKKEETLAEHVGLLLKDGPAYAERNDFGVVCLESRMVCQLQQFPANDPNFGKKHGIAAVRFDDENRGVLLAGMWKALSEKSRSVLYRKIPWDKYIGF